MRPLQEVRGLLTALDHFFFPAVCLLCARERPPGHPLLVCRTCRARLTPVVGSTCLVCRARSRGAEGFAAGRRCDEVVHRPYHVWAAVQMIDPADELVHALKFRDRPELGRTLALLLARRLRSAGAAGWDVVVPLPLHRARERQRGYNQAGEIAGPLARRLGARLLPRALGRTRSTDRQADLDYEARSRNVSGAFRASAGRRQGELGGELRGRRILVVDDVTTTGHTLLSALEALQGADPATTAAAVFALA
jgi:ComF family protein